MKDLQEKCCYIGIRLTYDSKPFCKADKTHYCSFKKLVRGFDLEEGYFCGLEKKTLRDEDKMISLSRNF